MKKQIVKTMIAKLNELKPQSILSQAGESIVETKRRLLLRRFLRARVRHLVR
jgi:hypothetical protein